MKIAALLLALLLISGCGASVPSSVPEVPENPEPVPEISEPEVPEEPAPTEIEYPFPESTEPESAVENYFSALYDSYTAMLPVDLSKVINPDFEMMGNVQNWNDLLAMRRSIISENGYCFVETERLPYTINYIEEKDLSDQRMDYVRLSDFGEGAKAVHFIITGEAEKAYPPIFALNSEHSMVLTEENGVYKIAYHYFPGSEGKFQNDLPVSLMEREDMEKLLAEEFSPKEEEPFPGAEFARIYDGEKAAKYAFSFCEAPNPDFSFVGDWYGNCMNFASQCIWSGFKTETETAKNYDSMTKNWYSGKEGGTLIWASVSRFYEWTLQDYCKMQTAVFFDISKAEKGDLVHIGSYACETEDKYTHALMVADAEKMLLAQNSPACFVYYSDLVNNYARFIRPVSLIE
ncbi:MAG: amidase domain-containing protein [Oscillospiraceae bacterium]|nr:amidase domain-containing protein [Oscillospiraceae bacterium]